MNYDLYAIYDAATGWYGIPMAQDNDTVAMRSFAHEAMKPDSIWNSHPQDFVLYKVGEYSCKTGQIIPYDTPERICCAKDFVKEI